MVLAPVVLVGAAGGALANAVFGGGGGSSDTAVSASWGGDPAAVSDIPPEYLALYQAAGARFGVAWPLLAGIGRIESDDGRDLNTDMPNSAGAIGPMQFLPATFAEYHGAAGDADASITDPKDAIYAAAAMLAADGIETNPWSAIYAYNHADWYVAEVLAWALAYGWSSPDTSLLARAVADHPNIGRADAASSANTALDPQHLYFGFAR